MTVIKYAVKSKQKVEQPKDPRRIRLTYDMIMAPTKELHLADSFYTFVTKLAVPEVRSLFTDLAGNGHERATEMLELRDDSGLSCNYFALRRGGEPVISYLPHAKIKDAAGSEWVKSSRQTMKPGRFLNTLFNADTLKRYNVTDTVLERFTNQVKSYVDVRVKLIEVEGEDIEYWYSPHRYSSKAGANLKQSCMNKDEFEATKFTFYMQNPNCHMLVAVDEEFKLMGRALLWRNCKGYELNERNAVKNYNAPIDMTFMDRVYAGEDFVEEAFKTYAQEQGFYYRGFKKYDYQTQLVGPDGKSINMMVTCPSGMTRKLRDYPYVDSMKWITRDLLTLTNYPATQVGNVWDMSSSYIKAQVETDAYVTTDLDGETPAANVIKCLECKKTGDLTNMYIIENQVGAYDKRVCRYCYSAKYVSSQFEGRVLRKADATLVKYAAGYHSDYVSKGNAVVSKHHGYNMIKAYARHLPIDDDWVSRHEDIVPATFHGCFIWRRNATWYPELNSFVHNTRKDQAEEAIKLGVKTEADLKARHAALQNPEPQPSPSAIEAVA